MPGATWLVPSAALDTPAVREGAQGVIAQRPKNYDNYRYNNKSSDCQDSDQGVYYEIRRADRVKLVFWDGTGVCLFAKRLEDGKFRWPKVEDGVVRLTAAELSALLEGLDWRRVRERPRQGVAPVAAS